MIAAITALSGAKDVPEVDASVRIIAFSINGSV